MGSPIFIVSMCIGDISSKYKGLHKIVLQVRMEYSVSRVVEGLEIFLKMTYLGNIISNLLLNAPISSQKVTNISKESIWT